MVRRTLAVLITCAALIGGGCQQNASTPADGTPAEVPEPGPAADPGPAPADQWEPKVEERAAPDSSTTPESTDESASPPENEQSGTQQSNEDDGVSLKIQPWEATEQLISAHQGKIVVVDFWSTSCLPCRREFPHLVELHKSHQDEVACVSVSLDYSGRKSRPPETYREPVSQFLTEQGATFDNVLSSEDPDELGKRLELAPIPVVWVYDQDGNLSKQFDNTDPNSDEFTYVDDIVPYVESLLAKRE